MSQKEERRRKRKRVRERMNGKSRKEEMLLGF